MITLNVNIDHVATVRQARGGFEPEPVTAAMLCELAGASGIVCHLREDRRHINDRDLELLRKVVRTKLDLEMAAVDEIIKIAIDTKPELVTIVPEKRQELTTEGGLNIIDNIPKYRDLSAKMHDNGIEVSYFIEPSFEQIDAALEVNADMVELHTGNYANLISKEKSNELARLIKAADYAKGFGLKVAAGHGLNYVNTQPLCNCSSFDEFSIGHSIISRAIFVGIDRAVKEMLELIEYSQLYYKK